MNDNSEHPQLLVHPLLLLAAAVIGTLLLGRLIPLPFVAELPAHIVGMFLLVGGLLFGFPAFREMLHARTTLNPLRPSAALVEGGTYRLTRNPMYLGMLVAYAGLFIFLRNAWFLPLLPALVWLMTIGVVIPEERYLQQRFGEDFVRFAARVPRWI